MVAALISFFFARFAFCATGSSGSWGKVVPNRPSASGVRREGKTGTPKNTQVHENQRVDGSGAPHGLVPSIDSLSCVFVFFVVSLSEWRGGNLWVPRRTTPRRGGRRGVGKGKERAGRSEVGSRIFSTFGAYPVSRSNRPALSQSRAEWCPRNGFFGRISAAGSTR